MKYKSLPKTQVSQFTLPALDGGLNLQIAPDSLSNHQLAQCKNMWHSGGLLRTRPGLYADENALLYRHGYGWDESECRITDTLILHGGVYRRVAYVKILEDDSIYSVHFYLLGDDGGIEPAGVIHYNRVSSDAFYAPENITVFTGAPVKGGGLYAFVTLTDRYNESSSYCDVQEIGVDFVSWMKHTGFYIPTIYINGRGNDYALASSHNQAYSAAPVELEAPNLLNGWFYAYFTSDGYSSSFRLPISSLSEGLFTCRMNITPTSFCEWRILDGQNEDTQPFLSVSVTARLDREKGILEFISAGQPYPLPKMSRYFANNIKIMAYNAADNGFEKIVSCTSITQHNARIFLSGGRAKNVVYSALSKNPLYFPLGATVSLGDDNSPVTALSVQNNRVVAFKQNELYSISLTAGGLFSKNSLLSDNPALFLRDDRLKSNQINNRIGCFYPRTLTLCDGRLIWLGTDRAVYMLDSTISGNVTEISMPVSKVLQSASPAALKRSFAVSFNGYYLLMIVEKGLIMDYRVRGYKNTGRGAALRVAADPVPWYLWEFPAGITMFDAYAADGVLRPVCCKANSNIIYLAQLKGDRDIGLTAGGTKLVPEETVIESSFSTAYFDLGSFTEKKNITGLFLSAAGDGPLTITLKAPGCEVSHKIGLGEGITGLSDALTPIRLLPNMYAGGLQLSVHSNAEFRLGALRIDSIKTAKFC